MGKLTKEVREIVLTEFTKEIIKTPLQASYDKYRAVVTETFKNQNPGLVDLTNLILKHPAGDKIDFNSSVYVSRSMVENVCYDCSYNLRQILSRVCATPRPSETEVTINCNYVRTVCSVYIETMSTSEALREYFEVYKDAIEKLEAVDKLLTSCTTVKQVRDTCPALDKYLPDDSSSKNQLVSMDLVNKVNSFFGK